MSDRYAVFGNPIKHSKSPEIHAFFAKQTAQDIVYTKQLIARDDFAIEARQFFDGGGLGLNITVPFKEEAFRFADTLTERALDAKAINTLARLPNGLILGDNTDGAGLVNDLSVVLRWRLKGQRVLILGAGGAVKGVLHSLLKEEPEGIVIANRTAQRAFDLAAQYSNVLGASFEDLENLGRFDLIINGTSASLSGTVPPLSKVNFDVNTAAYDMVYANEPTAFLRYMSNRGIEKLADGIGMLVGQAAESFYLWRAVKPDIDTTIQAIKKGA